MLKITLPALLFVISNVALSKEPNESAQTIDSLKQLDNVVLELQNSLNKEEANMLQWLHNIWKNYTSAHCLWSSKLKSNQVNKNKYNLCMKNEISHRKINLVNISKRL